MYQKDLTGQRFGRLTVLSYSHQNKHGVSMWLCKCDCGNKGIFNSNRMKRGKTKSCGCYNIECIKKRSTTHHLTDTPIYIVWEDMRGRCNNPNDSHYNSYGGRGIKVCDEWENSFENFYEDMGSSYKEGLSIDRINVNKGYSKENCRWATDYQQANNKTNTFWVTVKGKTGSLKELCDYYNVSYKAVWYRVRRLNWSVEKAIFTSSLRPKRAV